MKFLKIIIIVLALVAVSLGLVHMYSGNANIDDANVIDVNANSKMNAVKETIDKEIVKSTAPTIKDLHDSYEEIKQSIELYFNKEGQKEASSYASSNSELNAAYATAFIKAANRTFSGHTWSHEEIGIIRNDIKKLRTLYPTSDELVIIEMTINDYDKLVEYMADVNNLVNKRASDNNSRWDNDESERILSSIPNPSGIVRNSPLYEATRIYKVRETLNSGHQAFIASLIGVLSRTGGEYAAATASEELDSYVSMALSDNGYQRQYSEVNAFFKKQNNRINAMKYK